jgi:hypothetical protein
MSECSLCHKRPGSAILGKADEVEMVVMIGKNRFGLVAEVHEELNVSGCAEHGAGIELVGIGRGSFDLANEGLPYSSTLVCGTHGKQSDHADAGYRPEAHRADDRSFFLCHENMFLSRILFQALESFGGPAADLVQTGIFTECGLLHLEERRKIRFGGWSNVNHDVDPGLGKDSGPS